MAATVWRGRITFGLVSIPVRLYKAARRERIRFHRVQRARPSEDLPFETPETEEEDEGSVGSFPLLRGTHSPARSESEPPTRPAAGPPVIERVHQAPVGGPDDAPVRPGEILKGYEIAKDQYVVLEPHEVAALKPKTSSNLEIAEFVQLAEIDPVYFDTSYYIAPEPGGEKPYALLFRTLRETGYVAMGMLAMHGREHATVVRPGARGLLLHTLFYANEVSAATEFQADAELAAPKELGLAKMLVGALAGKFDPGKLRDTFEDRLRALIDSRSERAVSAGAPPEARKAPVVDIAEALRKSLEMMRKPAQTEAPPAEKAPKRRRARG